MVEISIIIPVYNCEKYIEQCIRSIQKQTLHNIEIICVNDGSTDKSGFLLTKLAKEDGRIVVYKQSNKGAGEARNVGLKKAQGEFVAFLDADDYYKDNAALQMMVEKCRLFSVNACGSVMNQLVNGKERRAVNVSEVVDMAQKGVLEYSAYPLDYDFTTFIFKRMELLENQIEFPQYRFYEDPPFLVKALNSIGKYVMADVDLYCYRIITNGKSLTEVKCLDLLKGLKDNIDYSKDNNLEKLFVRTVQRIDYEYCDQICNHLSNSAIEGIEQLLSLNKAVRRQSGYSDYVIRPIKILLERNVRYQSNYKENLIKMLRSETGIYIFGAGTMARKLLILLEEEGLARKIKGFLVSAKENNPEYIDEKPVFLLKEKTISLEDKILVAVSGLFIADIVKLLKDNNLSNFEIVDASCLTGY